MNKIWAVLLTQRKEFTLHACAVLFHKKAYLFTGSQMSTKLFGSYFREEGYTVYSDSISLLRFQPNNQIQIVEGFQNVRYNSSMPINKGKQYLLPVKLDQIINVETMTMKNFEMRGLSKKEIVFTSFKKYLSSANNKSPGIWKRSF